ncbi:hypothetical protein KFE25_010342 [Diacronema lutheri]|uniref:histidine kinase n=1 Tax=Diacronema lutheri TaxID=2081491 RepID=A0A8J6C5D0_DIALT|nr:hypothetical protein KFE25_010342 [Diacronema lutheri]
MTSNSPAPGCKARACAIRHVMHNLRSPLLSVLASASTLSELPGATTLADADVQSCIAIVHACAQVMEQTLDAMLDFEALEMGTLALCCEPFTVAELLAHVPTVFGDAARRAGVQLVVCAVPPLLLHREFVGDVRRLRQALHAGVHNALASAAVARPSAPVGSVTVSVDFGRERGDGLCALDVRVTDTGGGLSADALARLRHGWDVDGAFNEISDGQLRGEGGTGLSLAIARRVLHLHHGSTLELSSNGPGTGATLTLRVACAGAPQQPHVTPPRPSRATRASPKSSPPPSEGALMASHSEPKQFELRARSLQGLEVAPAAPGPKAQLSVLHVDDGPRERPYALILMDNTMPVLSGTKATALLRQMGYSGTIVGFTGDPPGCDAREHFELSGVDACVCKGSPGMHWLRETLREMQRLAPNALAADDGLAGALSPNVRRARRSGSMLPTPPPAVRFVSKLRLAAELTRAFVRARAAPCT